MEKFYNRTAADRKGGKGGNRSAGGPTPWKRAGGGDDRGERPALHAATCSACGAACEVPFKPNGKKPVLCRDCYRKEEGGGEWKPREQSPRFDRSAAPARAGGGNDDVARQLKALNEKMDLILEALTDLGKEGDEDEDEA